MNFYLTCFLIFFTFSNLWASKIQLIYEGDLVSKTETKMIEEKEFISLKAIAKFFKGKTQVYPVGKKVILQFSNKKLTFSANSYYVLLGNKKIKMEHEPLISNGDLYIDLEFFLQNPFPELVNCKLEWNPEHQIFSAEPNNTLFPPRIFNLGDSTKIVFESKNELSFQITKKGRSLLIHIPKSRIGKEDFIELNDPLVESLKMSHAKKGTDIKIILTHPNHSYHWTKEEEPTRFILEVKSSQKDQSIEDESLKPENMMTGVESQKELPLEHEIPQKTTIKSPENFPPPLPITPPSKIKRIVIDAGHGGKDPGAIGKNGTKEKDINLLIALELERLLRIEGGYETYLTRTNDDFISLVDRSSFANQKKADLFISIHCNASMKRSEGGFEIYFLAENASDPHAESLADFENSVIELEGKKANQNRHLKEILSSMAQNEFINESSLLCQLIDKAVRKRVKVKSRGVKQANFHVLHGVGMPSILVENAFVTNLQEEKKLRERRFRSSLVDSIFSGVQKFVRLHP
ncbi:MAG: N-acetylmuramoyl-L-alanine amidase [Elusimicrobia bacterium]|nr:N-acetylmuramoyl-L-alanine amidase [Elusimicrobiota bacterium]